MGNKEWVEWRIALENARRALDGERELFDAFLKRNGTGWTLNGPAVHPNEAVERRRARYVRCIADLKAEVSRLEGQEPTRRGES